MPLAFIFAAMIMLTTSYFVYENSTREHEIINASAADVLAANMLSYSKQITLCVTEASTNQEIFNRYSYLSTFEGSYEQLASHWGDCLNTGVLANYKPMSGVGIYIRNGEAYVYYDAQAPGVMHKIPSAGMQKALRSRTQNSVNIGIIK